MGDMGELYNDLRAHRRALRLKHGVECPACRVVRPKSSPTVMLPGQKCKVDGYVDPRPRLTDEEQ